MKHKLEKASSITSANSRGEDDDLTILESSALHQLLLPDGYYNYLDIAKPQSRHTRRTPFTSTSANIEDEIDVDAVKRNYRKLSLKHHPDRRGGDAETFRLLARAKKVLCTPKLREQYDLLGLDLDDDVLDADHENDHVSEDSKTASGDSAGGRSASPEHGGATDGESGNSDSILSTIASAVLAFLLQMMVRTIFMALVVCFISKYRFVIFAAWIFLGFVAFRIRQAAPQGFEGREYLSLIGIGMGIWFMYSARAKGLLNNGDGLPVFWYFWLGEAVTMTLFLRNSFPGATGWARTLGIAALSSMCSFVLRGYFARYVFVFFIFGGLAILSVIVFPILDMLLEELINEKMRKVGEKVRHGAEKQVEELARLRALCRTQQLQINELKAPTYSPKGVWNQNIGGRSNKMGNRSNSMHEMD